MNKISYTDIKNPNPFSNNVKGYQDFFNKTKLLNTKWTYGDVNNYDYLLCDTLYNRINEICYFDNDPSDILDLSSKQDIINNNDYNYLYDLFTNGTHCGYKNYCSDYDKNTISYYHIHPFSDKLRLIINVDIEEHSFGWFVNIDLNSKYYGHVFKCHLNSDNFLSYCGNLYDFMDNFEKNVIDYTNNSLCWH